jgi:outer membrane protein assembly factor BamB
MRYLGILLLAFATTSAFSQTVFTRGEVIVTSATQNGFQYDSTVSVFRNDGTFSRTLVSTPLRLLTEPFVRDGVVYVGARSPHRIERITPAGTFLAPFATAVVNINYLSPGPNNGLLAMNVSGEIYQFAADGTLLRYRNAESDLPGTGGLDLAGDQCSVIYVSVTQLLRWNACTNSPATLVIPSIPDASLDAIRNLPDGTFLLTAVRNGGTVLHVSGTGAIIREYAIPQAFALALDPDGTSFWTNAANFLLRVDIATGTILSQTYTDELIFGISVVGEPRAGVSAPATAAPIPTLSPLALSALAISLVLIARQLIGR